MYKFNLEKLKLTSSSFEYEVDPSFDLDKGSFTAFLEFLKHRIKMRKFSDAYKEKLLEKVNRSNIQLFVCSDCKRDVFSSKNNLMCEKCSHFMVSFESRKSSFVCVQCSESWHGYIYHDLCPTCR